MVIHNLDFFRARICPFENDSPLVIDPNGVPTTAPSPESFETVPRRNRQICQESGPVELYQFPCGNPCNGSKAAASLFTKKFFRF